MPATSMSRLPGGTQWAGEYTPPSEIIKKTLSEREEVNKRTKLTWSSEDERQFPTDRMVGQVNLAKPYMKIGTRTPGRWYYLQNMGLFSANGTPTSMDEISIVESHDPELLDILTKANETFIKDAASRDDAICKICFHYRSGNHEDYLRHVIQNHPQHALKVAGIEPAPVKEEPVVEVAASGSVPRCERCNQSFKDNRGLRGHNKFKHGEA